MCRQYTSAIFKALLSLNITGSFISHFSYFKYRNLDDTDHYQIMIDIRSATQYFLFNA